MDGDLLDEPRFFAFISDGYGYFDEFFLYRRKVGIKAQPRIGIVLGIVVKDALFDSFGIGFM